MYCLTVRQKWEGKGLCRSGLYRNQEKTGGNWDIKHQHSSTDDVDTWLESLIYRKPSINSNNLNKLLDKTAYRKYVIVCH